MMDIGFGMDDDLTTYSDGNLKEALKRATQALEVAERQLSEAAGFKLNMTARDNLAAVVQELVSYVGRINAEVVRRRSASR
jgi:hypothetical protein